ncbi:MAG TPA: CHAD domain-containing protein [Candidatus Binataceae bacterium]|nr:CHAD domain-containing protein [Candidatus Binataceae bacterium]
MLTRQTQKFQQLLARVLSAEGGDAVHDLRVCTRRLQQILTVLAAGTSTRGRGLRRELRGVRAAVGNWRNCDVILQRVERQERAARSRTRRAGWNLLREALEQRRRRQIRRAQHKLLKPGLLAVADSAARILAAARTQRGAPALRERVRMALAKAHERWQAAVAALEQQPSDENFHLLRIKTKSLRYRIELAGELGLPAAAVQIAWLRGLQDRLGRWHDRRELSLSIARTLAKPKVLLAQPRLAADLLREVERQQRHGQAEMDRILDQARHSPGSAALQRWIKDLSQAAPLSDQLGDNS